MSNRGTGSGAWAGSIGILLIVALGAAPRFSAFAADTLPAPAGPVLLTVDGLIANTNAPDATRFDRAMLERLGLVEIKTHTASSDGIDTFTGVPARALIASVGATGTTATAIATNYYKADIPLIDSDQFGVILALTQNGRTLSLRDRGPLWIVYPPTEADVGKRVDPHARMVWQLTRLTIRDSSGRDTGPQR